MKILYVEDEISQNIPRIKRLLGKYLGQENIRQLDALDKDNDKYAPAPEEIKSLVEKTNIVDIEYRFPDALRRVMQGPEKYSLLIIDRNLAGSEYSQEEIRKIDRNFNEELATQYSEREGDYLLLKLGMSEHARLINNVYFLTAYSPALDDLRSSKALERANIDLERFREKNIFEKDSPHDIKKLQDKLDESMTKTQKCSKA